MRKGTETLRPPRQRKKTLPPAPETPAPSFGSPQPKTKTAEWRFGASPDITANFRAALPLAPRKHSRRTSLAALVRLVVFSLAFFFFICPRQRKKSLPPAPENPGAFVRVSSAKNKNRRMAVLFLAEKRRLELLRRGLADLRP